MADIILYSIIIVLVVILLLVAKKAYVPTVVLFHRTTCGACQSLKPEWSSYKSGEWVYNIREVDGDDKNNSALLSNFDVKTVPSIWKVYPDGSRFMYTGTDRTAKAISDFARSA